MCPAVSTVPLACPSLQLAPVGTASSHPAAARRCVGLPGSIFHTEAMETHAFGMNTSESCSSSAGMRFKARAGYGSGNTERVSV